MVRFVSRAALALAIFLPAAAAQAPLERGLYASVEHRSDALMFSELDDDVVWVVGHRFSSGLDLAVLGSHTPSNGGTTFANEGRIESISQSFQVDRYGLRAGFAAPLGQRFISAASLTVLAENEQRRTFSTVSTPGEPPSSTRFQYEEQRLIVAGTLDVQAPLRVAGPLSVAPALGVGLVVEPWDETLSNLNGTPDEVRSDVTVSAGPYARLPLRVTLPRSTSLTVDAAIGVDFTRGAVRPAGGRYGTLVLPRGSIRASFSF